MNVFEIILLCLFFCFELSTFILIFYQSKLISKYKEIIVIQDEIIKQENKVLIKSLNEIVSFSIRDDIQDFERANVCKNLINELNGKLEK